MITATATLRSNISVTAQLVSREVGSCADATVELNGTEVGTIASGGTESFPVTQDGSPVGSWNGTEWIIPVPLADELRQDWQAHPSIADAYYSYIGVAPNGSTESADVWFITRITVFQNGTSTDPSPTAEDVAWTDRLTVIYS